MTVIKRARNAHTALSAETAQEAAQFNSPAAYAMRTFAKGHLKSLNHPPFVRMTRTVVARSPAVLT